MDIKAYVVLSLCSNHQATPSWGVTVAINKYSGQRGPCLSKESIPSDVRMLVTAFTERVPWWRNSAVA